MRNNLAARVSASFSPLGFMTHVRKSVNRVAEIEVVVVVIFLVGAFCVDAKKCFQNTTKPKESKWKYLSNDVYSLYFIVFIFLFTPRFHMTKASLGIERRTQRSRTHIFRVKCKKHQPRGDVL